MSVFGMVGVKSPGDMVCLAGTTVCAYIFAGLNFRGWQICTIFADFIFADERVVHILYCMYTL